MIRHLVLFKYEEAKVTPEIALRIKEGLAYISFASRILALDFGEDLGIGGVSTHDLALHHDHASRETWDAYNEDGHHKRVGGLIKSVTVPDVVARVDWAYEGPPATRFMVRDLALFAWDEGVEEAQKTAILAGLKSLRSACPTVRSLEFGADLEWYPPNHDWTYEAHFDDADGFRAFLEHPAQQEVAALIAAHTRSEVTARLQHAARAG